MSKKAARHPAAPMVPVAGRRSHRSLLTCGTPPCMLQNPGHRHHLLSVTLDFLYSTPVYAGCRSIFLSTGSLVHDNHPTR
jgi:hypothetical protein